MPSLRVTTIVASPVHAIAIVEPNTFVSVFSGRARVTDITTMSEVLLRAASVRRPKKLAVLTIVAQGSTIGERGRAEIAEMMRASIPVASAWSIVLEGDGFTAASARAATAGILMFAKTPTPVHVSSTVDAGLDWLHTEIRHPIDDLPHTIARLRRELEQQTKESAFHGKHSA